MARPSCASVGRAFARFIPEMAAFRQLSAALCLSGFVSCGFTADTLTRAAPAFDPLHASSAPLQADLVTTGLYVIRGGGANSLLRLSSIGSILVNGKLPGNYRPLMAQVRRISRLSDLPVRVLIVTDHHDVHAGNDTQFRAAGVALIAHENAFHHLPEMEDVGGNAPAPTVGYERAYTLRMGGVEVELFHFGSAVTDDDTVVYFPDLRVVAVGDLFTSGVPQTDYPGGGSLLNWGNVLARVLDLNFDLVVPSAGPVVTRAALEAFKARIDLLGSRARALAKAGVSKEQFMAQLNAEDPAWLLGFSGDQLERVYAEASGSQ